MFSGLDPRMGAKVGVDWYPPWLPPRTLARREFWADSGNT